MWQWLCFEQYNLEPNLGTSRFWLHSLKKTPEELGEKLVEKQRLGHAALGVLEQGLAGRDWLVGGQYSLADIGLYAYTHVAADGGFDLGPYPAVREWCARIAARPGHRPITAR
jgi:glutathione S-transferase